MPYTQTVKQQKEVFVDKAGENIKQTGFFLFIEIPLRQSL
jgi:hypothetical protein